MTTCPKKNTYDHQHWLGSCCSELFFWFPLTYISSKEIMLRFYWLHFIMPLWCWWLFLSVPTHWIFEFFWVHFFLKENQFKSIEEHVSSFKFNSQTILFQLNSNETKQLQINSFYWIPSWTMTIFFIINYFLQVCKRILKFLAKF